MIGTDGAFEAMIFQGSNDGGHVDFSIVMPCFHEVTGFSPDVASVHEGDVGGEFFDAGHDIFTGRVQGADAVAEAVGC